MSEKKLIDIEALGLETSELLRTNKISRGVCRERAIQLAIAEQLERIANDFQKSFQASVAVNTRIAEALERISPTEEQLEKQSEGQPF